MKFLVSVTDWEGLTYYEATEWCVWAYHHWPTLSLCEKKKLLAWGSALSRADCDDESGVLMSGKYPLSGELLSDLYEKYDESYTTLGWILGCGKDTIRRRIAEAHSFE